MRISTAKVVLSAFFTLVTLAPTEHIRAQTLSDLYPQIATLTASGATGQARFGSSISLSGDTVVVGSPNDDFGRGAVRVFVRSGGVWTLQQTLAASNPPTNSGGFGSAVSVSGNTLAVGIPGDNLDSGSVRVFVRSGGVWTEQELLTFPGSVMSSRFGAAVAVSNNLLVVGAPRYDTGAAIYRGAAYAFVRTNGSWSPRALVLDSEVSSFAEFGSSLSLSGNELAVGAPRDAVGGNPSQGSVSVFAIDVIATRTARLTATDGAAGDGFGSAVSLSGDTLAVGAPNDNLDQGSARVFARVGSSWQPRATLAPTGLSGSPRLGSSVAVSGTTLVAGARTANGAGSALVFARTGDSWTKHATIMDGSLFSDFGASVSMSGDMMAIGAPSDAVGSSLFQGTVRIYGNHKVKNATTGTFHPSLAEAISSGFSGDRLLVGAPAFAEASGIIDASQKRLTFTALEPLTLSANALMTVASDTVFEKSPAVASGGLTVNGRLVAPVDGTVTFERVAVGLPGQLAQRGSDLLVNHSLTTLAGGVSYLEGTVLAPSVATEAGAQHRVAADTNVFSNYANAGATIIQRGILYIYGTLSNTGTITGEFNNGFLPPSPGDGFSIGDDYVVAGDASIVLPDPVWWLRVGGSFDVKIDSADRFVMDQATLELTGLGLQPEQSVEVLSRDLGADEAGFATANFPIGAVRLRAGTRVSLVDNHGNAGGKGAQAIYTQELVVPAGALLLTNGHRIYTRTATIAGEVSNPDDIVIVPGTPPCVADIVTDGVVNGADLALVLTNWGPCASSTCVADIDRDGTVGASDLSIILASWGGCAN